MKDTSFKIKSFVFCFIFTVTTFYTYINTENHFLRSICFPFSFFGFLTGYAKESYALVGNVITTIIIWLIILGIRQIFIPLDKRRM